MYETDFWQLIDESRDTAEGDPDEQADALVERLAQLTPDDVVDFARLFEARFPAGVPVRPVGGGVPVAGRGFGGQLRLLPLLADRAGAGGVRGRAARARRLGRAGPGLR
ncbi:hypothetical protein GCM10020229_36100 [Kitasatospora albolonga]